MIIYPNLVAGSKTHFLLAYSLDLGLFKGIFKYYALS